MTLTLTLTLTQARTGDHREDSGNGSRAQEEQSGTGLWDMGLWGLVECGFVEDWCVVVGVRVGRLSTQNLHLLMGCCPPVIKGFSGKPTGFPVNQRVFQ